MTLQEMEKFTGLPEDELESYYSEGLIGREKEGIAVFDWQDAKDTGLIRTLKGCGMTAAELRDFFCLVRQNQILQATKLLCGLLARLLKSIHEGQSSLDTLDCIIRVTEHKA